MASCVLDVRAGMVPVGCSIIVLREGRVRSAGETAELTDSDRSEIRVEGSKAATA